ncbi:MAG: GNAT family N-acetyltransferase [Actinomycetota bacterium]
MDAPLDLITLPAGLTARPVTMDDLDAVVELVRGCEEHDYGRPELDPEDLVVDWARPGMDLAVMSVALFDDHVMVAEAEAFQGRGEVNIHPVHRGRGIGTAILPWLHAIARSQGPTLRQIAHDTDTERRGFLLRHGYRETFTSWVLAISLEGGIEAPALPLGFAFRDFRPGVDDRETYRVIEDAFSEWEGRRAVTFEDWAGLTIGRESFDPSNMLLAVDEATDEIVGVVFMIDYGIEDGWIQQVATKATHRHRGIARALLHRAFQVYGERGKKNVELSTDSRTGALGLYEKVGMRVFSSYTNYVKDLHEETSTAPSDS